MAHGLVDMEHSHPPQQVSDPGKERRLQQAGGAAADPGDELDQERAALATGAVALILGWPRTDPGTGNGAMA